MRTEVSDDGVVVSKVEEKKMVWDRLFTKPGVHPFHEIKWEKRDILVKGANGEIVFEQRGCEFPMFWGQRDCDITVRHYFRGALGSSERESSLKQVIVRVVKVIRGWGEAQGYLVGEDGEVFEHELCYMLVHQMFSFNSPVWYNVGQIDKPQCSACFINRVDDSIDSIMDLAVREVSIFKGGSGAGGNLSYIRGSCESLSGGGVASGPVSFMRGWDAFAGAIKSGGRTRRAAKMTLLDADHPDIFDYVECKAKDEEKIKILLQGGFEGGLDGDAILSGDFQNANNTVRVNDKFMKAVVDDGFWGLRARKSGETVKTIKARDLWEKIIKSAYTCADPGLHFADTVNRMHTCPEAGEIRGSNPCAEFVFIDDSACNLASLNLLKFVDEIGRFKIKEFRHAVDFIIAAQEFVVDNSSYPHPNILRNSLLYRPLGLGYCNLGATLVALGIPYDSDVGRGWAASVTALMTGRAYKRSAEMTKINGSFSGFKENRESMLRVMNHHHEAVQAIRHGDVGSGWFGEWDPGYAFVDMYNAALEDWDRALEKGERCGFRNAQVTLLAPTGTTSFMMGADTTGGEPAYQLVVMKQLVGGGSVKIPLSVVDVGLKSLGYDEDTINAALQHLNVNETLEDFEGLEQDHLAVFDCANKCGRGTRFIRADGHIKMMAAIQPYLSGAISKTVNLPSEATEKELESLFISAWEMGLKSITIYRDGSKAVQPLQSLKEADEEIHKPVRRKLPSARLSITKKIKVASFKGYLTIGLYPDFKPGEIYIKASKEGSTISGLLDAFARSVSYNLQYGVPLQVLVTKFSNLKFEPSGVSDIGIVGSVIDYVFRWLDRNFVNVENEVSPGIKILELMEMSDELYDTMVDCRELNIGVADKPKQLVPVSREYDGPLCDECGHITQRDGATCWVCPNCGYKHGCS